MNKTISIIFLIGTATLQAMRIPPIRSVHQTTQIAPSISVRMNCKAPEKASIEFLTKKIIESEKKIETENDLLKKASAQRDRAVYATTFSCVTSISVALANMITTKYYDIDIIRPHLMEFWIFTNSIGFYYFTRDLKQKIHQTKINHLEESLLKFYNERYRLKKEAEYIEGSCKGKSK